MISAWFKGQRTFWSDTTCKNIDTRHEKAKEQQKKISKLEITKQKSSRRKHQNLRIVVGHRLRDHTVDYRCSLEK